MNDIQVDNTIRHEFISALMDYFKIEENINLREHIQDLIENIDKSQYREFLRRLSAGNMTYKTAFEKISIVAESFQEELKSVLFGDVKRRVKQLYDVMYELHRQIGLSSKEEEAFEAFENVYFSKIKDKNSDEILFDALDIEVIKTMTKEWIYNTVVFDKSLFIHSVENAYKNAILKDHNAINNVALENNSASAKLLES